MSCTVSCAAETPTETKLAMIITMMMLIIIMMEMIVLDYLYFLSTVLYLQL